LTLGKSEVSSDEGDNNDVGEFADDELTDVNESPAAVTTAVNCTILAS